jgi:hypothetical protein
VLVATAGSFGMGVDLPSLRCVIHYQLPESPTAYWQGVGRAGRDGEPALAVLLYQDKDENLLSQRIDDSCPSRDECNRVWAAISSTCANGPASLSIRALPGVRDLSVESVLKMLQTKGWIRYWGGAPIWTVEVVGRGEKIRHADIEQEKQTAHQELEWMAAYVRGTAGEGRCRRREVLNCFRLATSLRLPRTWKYMPFSVIYLQACASNILSRFAHGSLAGSAKRKRRGGGVERCCDSCDGLQSDLPLEEWLSRLPPVGGNDGTLPHGAGGA